MARGVARRSVGTIDLRHLAPFKCGTLQIAALDPTFQLSESCSGTRAVEKATANEKIKAKDVKVEQVQRSIRSPNEKTGPSCNIFLG